MNTRLIQLPVCAHDNIPVELAGEEAISATVLVANEAVRESGSVFVGAATFACWAKGSAGSYLMVALELPWEPSDKSKSL